LGARVDLLIVNLALAGAHAFSVQLEFGNPKLKIIQLTANRREEIRIVTARTPSILQKPDSVQAAGYWIGKLREVLEERFL